MGRFILYVIRNPIRHDHFFVVLYGKEINIENPGYFFIYMAIGVGSARLISGKLVDRGKIHVVSVASLLLLTLSFTLFGLIHTETIYLFAR
jgi:predicted MFS family arabinose efflux permease